MLSVRDIDVFYGDFHAVHDDFIKAAELFPNNPDTLFSLAKVNQQLGEHQVAIEYLKELETLNPGKSEYGEAIAESYFALQDYLAAEGHANRVLQSNARSSRASPSGLQASTALRSETVRGPSARCSGICSCTAACSAWQRQAPTMSCNSRVAARAGTRAFSGSLREAMVLTPGLPTGGSTRERDGHRVRPAFAARCRLDE